MTDIPPVDYINEPAAIVQHAECVELGDYSSATTVRQSTTEWRSRVAEQFHIPSIIIEAILKVENGKPGYIRYNQNGTCDIGEMQINSSNWHIFKEKGITPHQIQWDGFLNIVAAAYILRDIYDRAKHNNRINNWDDFLTITAEYHSGTEKYNQAYQLKLAEAINQLRQRR